MAIEWNGKRGSIGFKGRWIDIQEAKELTVGNEELWKSEGIGGRTVELKQHDPTGPKDKPIWLYSHGDMYLGEWKEKGSKGYPVEHGFGISYNSYDMWKGEVCVGNCEKGLLHGQGKKFWLESAPTWIKNNFPSSQIEEKVNGKSVGRPFTYKGEFVKGYYRDKSATVTLKHGTCRVGPWKYYKPIGDWWNDDEHPLSTDEAVSETRLLKQSVVTMAAEWNGRRGYYGSNGRWISLKEAKECAVGEEEWWKSEGIGGRTVAIRQHDQTGPKDKPIWLNAFGNMYLGEWKEKGRTGFPVEHGFGVKYWNWPSDHYKGKIYVGNVESGDEHGQGKQFWLESSPSWIKNELPNFSRGIRQKVNGSAINRPYSFEGEFVNGSNHDECATVTLKDGTCRAGPWKDNKPVGDWWNDDEHPLASQRPNDDDNPVVDTDTLPAGASSQESTAEAVAETRRAKRTRRESSKTEPRTVPDAIPSFTSTSDLFDEEDYHELRQRYFEKRIYTGEDAELPEGTRLRRRTMPPRIDTDTPGFRSLKKQIKSLKDNHEEIYKILKKLRHWEIHNTTFPNATTTQSDGDEVQEVFDLTAQDDDKIIDVDSYILEVLLVKVVKPDPDQVPVIEDAPPGEGALSVAAIKTEPGEADASL